MAKSAWKFSKFTNRDITLYLEDLKKVQKLQGKKKIYDVKNNIFINNLNYMHKYSFHLGNLFIFKRFNPMLINSKPSEFLKFTKPFNYRSKKKKNKC